MGTLEAPPDNSMLPINDDVLNCKLVGPFSIFVQVLVGTLGFSTLIIKRQFERPRRTWLVWSFDVGKQMISGSIMHMCNLLVSTLSGGSSSTAGEDDQSSNPCSWYVLNLTLDCTLGVLFLAGYIRLFEYLAARFKIGGLESGNYGDPPSWRIWLKQAFLFCASMLCMKLTVVMLVALLPFLLAIGDLILKPVLMTHSPHFEIIFVMAIWPLVLNIFESWVIDQFIKKKHPVHPTSSVSGHVPLETEEYAGGVYGASFEMHDASLSSGSRTLTAGSTRRHAQLSVDMSEFNIGSDSDGEDSIDNRRIGMQKTHGFDTDYHRDPFTLPSPTSAPTIAFNNGESHNYTRINAQDDDVKLSNIDGTDKQKEHR
ncbi:hypothetical protein H4S08_000387 [Coemansia sp. RSA 1365]|nr:hypothetical protein H4S08_000387 [Coemansia sp. RSA 1365]